MKNTLIAFSIVCCFAACSSSDNNEKVSDKDTAVQKELDQVDQMLKNDDSLYKAKERELLGK